jgi:hypothetical protein
MVEEELSFRTYIHTLYYKASFSTRGRDNSGTSFHLTHACAEFKERFCAFTRVEIKKWPSGVTG